MQTSIVNYMRGQLEAAHVDRDSFQGQLETALADCGDLKDQLHKTLADHNSLQAQIETSAMNINHNRGQLEAAGVEHDSFQGQLETALANSKEAVEQEAWVAVQPLEQQQHPEGHKTLQGLDRNTLSASRANSLDMAAEPEEARVAAQPTAQQQPLDTQHRPGPSPALSRGSSKRNMRGSRAGWRVQRHRYDFLYGCLQVGNTSCVPLSLVSCSYGWLVIFLLLFLT